MRNLTLEGKIVVFKTIAISKIVFQSFIITFPKHTEGSSVEKLYSKIKHETLCNDYNDKGLINIDI